jgi:hypothetical protein
MGKNRSSGGHESGRAKGEKGTSGLGHG